MAAKKPAKAGDFNTDKDRMSRMKGDKVVIPMSKVAKIKVKMK